jgi:hypothetical protein
MIPDFDDSGNLPPGRYIASWEEFTARFGTNDRRRQLLSGMKRMLLSLKRFGCKRAYIDGSFVTQKEHPGDYDGCWSRVGVNLQELRKGDPVLLDFTNERIAQKVKYGGEMFPAEITEGRSGRLFLDFFERDKTSGDAKGIVEIDLGGLS